MWDWEVIRGVCAIISAICALISAGYAVRAGRNTAQQPSRTSKEEGSLPKKALYDKTVWKWAVTFVVLSFVAAGLCTYQLADPDGDPAQATLLTRPDSTSTTPYNLDNPAPSKTNPGHRQPTPTQTPKPTLAPTLTPTPVPTSIPTATPDPTSTPTPTLSPTATTIPTPLSPPAPTLAFLSAVRPGGAIISVVIDRNPHLAEPLWVQTLSTLVTGVDGLSVEVHNAVCNNTEYINTKEWVQLRCGYDNKEQKQTVIEHIVAWHESVGYLRCEPLGIPNSLTMQFSCFAQ